MFCRVEVLVKREIEVSHYNRVPKPAVHLETAAGSSRLDERADVRTSRSNRLLVKSSVIYLCSFTITQENTADVSRLEL